MFVPHQSVVESDFVFFNKGREMWNRESSFKDLLEDKIRYQLEACDQLQGFQLTVDTNSGFSSLANQITTYFLKDEAPKAPVFLYAVKNHNQVDLAGVSEDERTNAETRQRLIDLN
jgi:hypothetical protein